MKKMFSIPNEKDIQNLRKNTKQNVDAGITDFARFLSPLDSEYLTCDNILQIVNNDVFTKNIGPIRIKLNINEINQLPREMIFVNSDNTISVGEFPQSIVEGDLENTLNMEYDKRNLLKTSKEYTIKVELTHENKYKITTIYEYFYGIDKFVFIEKNGSRKWFKVEPVYFRSYNGEWYSDKILFANIPLNLKVTKNSDFENSFLSEFLNTSFIVNILSTAVILLHKSKKNTITDDEKKLIINYYRNVPYLDLPAIRNKIETLGEEWLLLFDSIWINSDLKKAKQIINLKDKEKRIK